MAKANNVVVDLSKYKDRFGGRVTPGTYRVVVDDVELTTTKAGAPMVNMWLRIKGGEHEGATIMDRLVVMDKTLFRIVGFMQAIGLPTPRKRLNLDISKFMGKQLDVQVADGEPYNDTVRSEVRNYIKPEKKSVKDEPTTDDGADDLEEFSEEESQETPAEAVEETEQEDQVWNNSDDDDDSDDDDSDDDSDDSDDETDLDDIEDL